MPFETFKRQRLKTSTSPEVTIQRKGVFSLNRAAYEALGGPDAVELLYDREERLIGIRKVTPDTPHSYTVRPLNRGSTYLFSGTAFTNWYGIPTPVSKRWPGALQEDMLVVDLKQPGIASTSNRSKPQQNGDSRD